MATKILPDQDHPHRRYNPLNGRHVLVSPHRAKRPWLGHDEAPDDTTTPSYDPTCYLCPGNERVGGHPNPDYSATYVFENDFPALLTDSTVAATEDDLFVVLPAQGVSRVICFSPNHSLTLPDLSADAMNKPPIWARLIRGCRYLKTKAR
jgi:UDPglucose--hexose-1-phosphate uridylyltransferase